MANVTPVPVTRTMMQIPKGHQPAKLNPSVGSNAPQIADVQDAMQDGYGRACTDGPEMADGDMND